MVKFLLVVKTPMEVSKDRLVVGANKYGIRLQIMRFKEYLPIDYHVASYDILSKLKLARPQSIEYVGDDDMDRLEGLSFSRDTMRKIIKTIETML
jgi:hypothetical protein